MTELYILKKRGLFYRANSQGYTEHVTEAARYSEAEAKSRVAVGDGVTAHRLSEHWPEAASVADIPDDKLLERAVRNAKPRKGRAPKWAAVSDTFGLGSTFSTQLCRRFGVDPDQQVGRNGVVR